MQVFEIKKLRSNLSYGLEQKRAGKRSPCWNSLSVYEATAPIQAMNSDEWQLFPRHGYGDGPAQHGVIFDHDLVAWLQVLQALAVGKCRL